MLGMLTVILVLLGALVLAFAGIGAVLFWPVKRNPLVGTPRRVVPPPAHTPRAMNLFDQAELDELVREQKKQIDVEAARLERQLDEAVRRAWNQPAPIIREEIHLSRGPVKSGNKDGYKPPPPSGKSHEPWGRCSPYEVVGEYYYGDNIARLYKGVQGFQSDGGAELRMPATLVAAPDNPHGEGHAIAVWLGGQHVGYIAAEDSVLHFPHVMRLHERGQELVLDGRLWARKEGARVYARATIWLPAIDGYEAPLGYVPPEPHIVIPAGGRIQVTKENEHMDVLARHVLPGVERSVVATLHIVEEVRPRSTVEVVEVRIAAERVGVLSPTQTANLRPLIEQINKVGKMAVTRAEVAGNKLKAEVTLYASKAQDVDQHWLDQLS